MGDHTILFVFDNNEEVEKILASEPWSFDRHHVVLQMLEIVVIVCDVAFNKVLIWVQVHIITISFLNRGVAEELCEVIGEVDQDSRNVEVEGGSFIRVCVRVDISIPLCRGRVLSIEDGKEGWVSFKYKRLPNICYWCGCLDHTDRDCNLWIESDGTLDSSDQEYGAWIRAPLTPMIKKSVVVVPSFYESRKKGGRSIKSLCFRNQLRRRDESD